MINISWDDYMRRVRGCYLGKAVGGTLGMPFEGSLQTRKLTYYEPVPTQMAPNDDLDLQVIALEIVRRCGLPVNRLHLSDIWRHLQDAGPDEYGPARYNVQLGRPAPLSGYYGNRFGAGMGAAIRSELWACLAPGDPALAARLAREDACTDHYADGVDACVFLACVESAAFVESDPIKLLETGFSFLSPEGRLYQGLREAMRIYEQTRDAWQARALYLARYGVQNWTDVTVNLGLIVLSWLASGGDFGLGICTAAGLGYDADCTCATLGSIMGIINPEGISPKWQAPIGNDLILMPLVTGMHEPKTIDGFCDRVAATADAVLRYYQSAVCLDGVPGEIARIGMRPAWTEDRHAADAMDGPNEALIAVLPLVTRLVYPESVALRPEQPGRFNLILRNPSASPLRGEGGAYVPEGWRAEPERFGWSLQPGETCTIALTITADALEKRRPAINRLELFFQQEDGVSWTVSAGLALSIPWLRTDLDTGEETVIEADAPFQLIPAGRWRYRTAVRLITRMDVRFGVMSNRAFEARFHGDALLHGDGSFYVPAFHRGKTVARTVTGASADGWNTVEIDFEDGPAGEMFCGFARTHGCGEWLTNMEYSLAPLNNGKAGENK